MKKLIYFLFLLLMIFSCKKEKTDEESKIYDGFASVSLNGVDMKFHAILKKYQGEEEFYGFNFDYLNDNGFRRKTFDFSVVKPIFIGQKTHRVDFLADTLELHSSFGTIIDGNDVMGNFYFLNEDDDIEDYIHFSKFDKSSGDVVGTFQLSFVVDTSSIFDLSSPDTIVLTDGYFEATVME